MFDSFHVARVAEHSFLTGPIKPGLTIVDLGVNVAEFATTMVNDFGCSVVGVEPVPHLFKAMPRLDGLTVEQRAVAAESKPVTLHLSPSILAATIEDRLAARHEPTVEVQGITLAEILDRYDIVRAPLVKVDIEGAEIQMLESASLQTLQRVDQFTIEFHDFLEPSYAEAVVAVKKRLRSAGFVEMAFSMDNSDVLFVNRSQVAFTACYRASATLMYKYPRGIHRNIRRRVKNWQRARRAG